MSIVSKIMSLMPGILLIGAMLLIHYMWAHGVKLNIAPLQWPPLHFIQDTCR
jgi:hypothetical protein